LTKGAKAPRFVPPVRLAKGARSPERVREVVRRLRAEYADAETALHHDGPFQLLAATILSAQCTDARVNMVTPELFRRFPDPAALAAADRAELERLIHSTGFFRAKAKSLQGMAQAVVERHGGVVPVDMDQLTLLPGVGRKTANVLRGSAHDLPAVIVDTHCSRVSRRLGWTRHEEPERIERDLMKLLPEADWTFTSHAFVLHGRAVCHARRPECERCVLGADTCPSWMLEVPPPSRPR
jgi:endonuclease-3